MFAIRWLSCVAMVSCVSLLPACDRGPYYLAPADMPDTVRSAVDEAVLPLVNSYQSVGLVVGVIDQGNRYVLGYGGTSLFGGIAPTGDTVFEIGSITKTFTGVMLAEMVAEGAVSFDAPAEQCLPEGASLPSFEGREITLQDLATHTSGLPRLPGDLFTGEGYRASNPYAHYTVDDMLAFVSGYTLPRAPGTEYEYSNLAVGLLGNLLAHVDGTTYDAMFAARIAVPLGMRETTISLDEEQQARLAQPYANLALFGFSFPFPNTNWDLPAFAGAGAVRATVSDMLTYAAAAMGTKDTLIRNALDTSQQPRFTVNDRMQVGLCWHLITPADGGEPVIWHNGATGGYTGYIGFLRDAGVAVVILNNSNANLDNSALQILGKLAGRDFLAR